MLLCFSSDDGGEKLSVKEHIVERIGGDLVQRAKELDSLLMVFEMQSLKQINSFYLTSGLEK